MPGTSALPAAHTPMVSALFKGIVLLIMLCVLILFKLNFVPIWGGMEHGIFADVCFEINNVLNELG